MLRIAVIGVGEAGQHYLAGFARGGAEASWYDPFAAEPISNGIEGSTSLAQALQGAELVVSLVGASAAAEVCRAAVAELGPTAIYADFNTGAPAAKRELAAIAASAGVGFVDVAVMAPVPRAGIGTPLLASGTAATSFAGLLRRFGSEVTVVGPEAGSAAARKLLRSVFMKGLAAVLLECQAAGDAAGCWDWLAEDISGELSAAGPELMERLLLGSRQHAVRRRHEMADAAAFLAELDAPSDVAQAAARWFERLIREAADAG
ncbi:MAG: NAD(P)-dependent oxidoreductase [Renibacterium sp.]|nr:NAD(P)-dependent oxidoreductase [Renibacterium sp.]